jgi:hypothetical protein
MALLNNAGRMLRCQYKQEKESVSSEQIPLY